MTENKHEKIYYGENAYIWVVQNKMTDEMWIFYDGEKAHKFAEKIRTTTMNKVQCYTETIEDLK